MNKKMPDFISMDELRRIRRRLRRMKPKPPKERLTAYLPRLYVTEDEYAQLEGEAKEAGVPMSRLIRDRIREGLTDEEKWRASHPRFEPVGAEHADALRKQGSELRALFENYERTGEMDMDAQAKILDDMEATLGAVIQELKQAISDMDAEDEQR